MEDINSLHSTTSVPSTPDIYEQIRDCLQIQNISNHEDIITDLLDNGRQSLKKYTSILASDVLSNQELLSLLKSNIIQTWDTIMINQLRIKEFYDEMKIRNQDLFNKMVEKIAENGNRHKENALQILFLVLQLSFPYITQMPDVLDILWDSITTNGIDSLRNSSEYIAPADLDIHLNYEQDETPLYLALRGYYKMKAAELFEKHHISDRNNLYNTAADAFTKTGWISGMEIIRSRIAPFLYGQLLRSVSNEIPVHSSTTNTVNPEECPQNEPSTVQPSSSPSILEMISQEISNYLQLNDYGNKNEIISLLFKGGRQMLFQYEALIKPEVFTTEKNWTKEQETETHLLELLREYTFIQLQILLEQSQSILFSLIKEQKDSGNSDHFRRVQTRFAEYGTIYTGSSFILSFVLQLLFDGITDDYIINENIFAHLFKSVTDKGIHGAEEEEYAKYIASDDLKEQITDEQSMLHLALRMYFHEEITHLFNQHGICDRNQRYKILAENVTKDGWLIGIESMKDKISQIQYITIHQAISDRLQYLSVTEATAPIIEEPIKERAPDHSTCHTPDTTVILLPQLQLDCESNEMLDDMKHILELAIVNRNSHNNNQIVWPEDQVDYQFQLEWTKKVTEFEHLFNHAKLLNDSIEYVHQNYYSQDERMKEKISTEMVSKFVELDSKRLVQEWKSTVYTGAVGLGDKCIMEAVGNAPSTQLNSPISVEDFIYINTQQLIESSSQIHQLSSSTSEQLILLSKNQTNNIITNMQKEMTENIFGPSNILLMNKFFEEIYRHIMNLIDDQNPMVKTPNELLEKISKIIKQTEATVNNELAIFYLKLSNNLLASIDSNTCLLLTIVHYQHRKKDLSKQYADLERNKPGFFQYFFELLINKQE